MGRAPCCDKANVKKGPWSPEEDAQLKEYIDKFGTGGNWIALPQKAGLRRCGKSCRLRWLNYLRPNIKHGEFSDEEDRIICSLYITIGSRWSIIAGQLPGRTDNDIKNYWNTKLKKKLMGLANNNQRSQLSHHKIKPNNNTPTTPYNPMLLHTSPPAHSPLLLSPALSSSPPYQIGTTLSFTGFDQSSFLQTPQQEGFQLNPNSNYLMFGGAAEPSCSSSDGSCNINNTTKYDQQVGFYNGSNSVEEDEQKMVFSSGLWEEITPPLMDYGMEEIKQLISTTTSAVNGGFNFDENKGGERAMLYY